MNPLQQKKGWWHSDLLKFANADGTVAIMFRGDPADSKYPGKLKWCGIVVEGQDGEQSEHTLNVEPEVEDQIRHAPKDCWIKVRVQGGKGEKPGIYVVDDLGPVFPEGEAKTPTYRPTRKDPVLVAEIAQEAADIAIDTVVRFKRAALDLGPSEAQAIFSTVFIQLGK